MLPVPFEVEMTFALQGRGSFVMARLVAPESSFHMNEVRRFGGYLIEQWFDIPRKPAADGSPRFDCFVFKLVIPSDAANLQPGDRVLLES